MTTLTEMAKEAGFHSPVRADGYMGLAYDRREGGETGGSLERLAELVRADERSSWPAEMEAMERQVNILTDALAEARRGR